MKNVLITCLILLFTSINYPSAACEDPDPVCYEDDTLGCGCHDQQCKTVTECVTDCTNECSWDKQYWCGCWGDKTEVCKVPPGNPANAHTICVSNNSVDAHLKTGSYLGSCDSCVKNCEKESCKQVEFCWCDHCDEECDDDTEDTDEDTSVDTGTEFIDTESETTDDTNTDYISDDTDSIDTSTGESTDPATEDQTDESSCTGNDSCTGTDDAETESSSTSGPEGDTGSDTNTVPISDTGTGEVDTGNTGSEDTSSGGNDTGEAGDSGDAGDTGAGDSDVDTSETTPWGTDTEAVDAGSLNNKEEIIFAGGGCSIVVGSSHSIWTLLF